MKNCFNAGFQTALSPEDEAEMRQIIPEVLHEADGDLDIDVVCERALYRKTEPDVDWLVRRGMLMACECGSYVHPKHASQHACGAKQGQDRSVDS